MKDEKINDHWNDFIIKYKNYFSNDSISQKEPTKKSTTIKPIEIKKQKEIDEKRHTRIYSEYQELTKKMSIQNSETTNKMFEDKTDLWHKYHDSRDFSFKGYDKLEEIPVNKIINYLKSKANRKLKILDLGCGRNLIKEHFKNNNKLQIIGYDHVSYNNSIKCNISKLPDEDETVDICIFSQSLMGSNWKEYINEASRVLRFNGEIIISESIERYDVIKNYIDELGYIIKSSVYENTNRWFYLHVLNDNKLNIEIEAFDNELLNKTSKTKTSKSKILII